MVPAPVLRRLGKHASARHQTHSLGIASNLIAIGVVGEAQLAGDLYHINSAGGAERSQLTHGLAELSLQIETPERAGANARRP